ncbi:hypothetical protein GCM10009593_29480 [Microlunatus antarcticus]
MAGLDTTDTVRAAEPAVVGTVWFSTPSWVVPAVVPEARAYSRPWLSKATSPLPPVVLKPVTLPTRPMPVLVFVLKA